MDDVGMKRYAVHIQGPRERHEMTVFAGSWDHAAEAGIEKIQDKIFRHTPKGRVHPWGPVTGPWKVLSIVLECE